METELYKLLSRHRTLEKVAFADTNGNSVSYCQLFDKAEGLAETLIGLMGEGNHAVAVYQEKSINAAVCVFGILAAGKAFVPIDPDFPAARVNYIVSNASIRMAIVSRNIPQPKIDHLISQGVVVLQYDVNTDISRIRGGSTDGFVTYAVPVSSASIAYILFTSGTTGRPKGVMIRDESQVTFVQIMAEAFGHDVHTRWLSVSPLYFDVCTLDLFVEIYCGSTVILMPPNMMAHELARAIEFHLITHTLLISSQVKMLASKFSGLEERDFSNLKELWYGGEACPIESLRRIQSLFPHIAFAQCYGPSEVCNNATLNRFGSVPVGAEGYMPLGRPIASVQAYVVDQNGDLLTGAGTGELLLGGVQVMEGYVNDEVLTNQVLIDNKFSPDSPYKVYRTGDFVQVDDQGVLSFYGRKDDLVKIRGNRVSVHEVQTAIVSLPQVLDAVVFVKKDNIGGALDSLNAVVVSNVAIQANELKIALREKLPKYMMPDYFHIASSANVPVKENGKLDRDWLLAQCG